MKIDNRVYGVNIAKNNGSYITVQDDQNRNVANEIIINQAKEILIKHSIGETRGFGEEELKENLDKFIDDLEIPVRRMGDPIPPAPPPPRRFPNPDEKGFLSKMFNYIFLRKN